MTLPFCLSHSKLLGIFIIQRKNIERIVPIKEKSWAFQKLFINQEFHIFSFRNMAGLFEQVSTLGRVEHQITKFAYGMWRPQPANSPGIDLDDKVHFSANEIRKVNILQFNFCGSSKSMPISVFVEIILNPENLNLERLTPVVFKVWLIFF